jgi:hypothetical protein
MIPEKRLTNGVNRKQKSNIHMEEFRSAERCHDTLISNRYVPLRELNFDDRPLTHTEESNKSMNALIKYIDKEGFAKGHIIVAETPKKMILLDGGRRVYAYRQLGREFIYATVCKFRSEEDMSAIRKIATSFRYLDKAKLIHKYFRVKLTSRSLKDLINSLIEHQEHQGRSNGELAETVDAAATLYGLKIGTVRKLLRLKRLPLRIQDALLNGNLGLSKAYLMARYHDREDLMDIFEQTIDQHLSNSALKRLLKADAHFVRCNLILGKLSAAIRDEVCLMGIDDIDSLVVETCDLLEMFSVYSRFKCILSMRKEQLKEDIQ